MSSMEPMISQFHSPAPRSLKLRSIIHGVIAVLLSIVPLDAKPIEGNAKFSPNKPYPAKPGGPEIIADENEK